MKGVAAVEATKAKRTLEKRPQTRREILRERPLLPRRRKNAEERQALGEDGVHDEERVQPAAGVLDVNPSVDERGERDRVTVGRRDRLEALEKMQKTPSVFETAERCVTLGIRPPGKAKIGPERLLEGGESTAVVALGERDVAKGGVRPQATRIARDGLAIKAHRFVRVTEAIGPLGRLATVMRENPVKVFAALDRQTHGSGVGLVPGALIFVYRLQTAERTPPVHGVRGDVREERFRTIVESRRNIIAREFVKGPHAKRSGEVRASDEVLMDPDGAFEFPAATEEVGERELHFVSFGLALREAKKNLERPIGLVVEKKAQSLERATHGPGQSSSRPPSAPTDPCRHDPEEEQKEEDGKDGRAAHESAPSLSSDPPRSRSFR
jgi:hypothetical protein